MRRYIAILQAVEHDQSDVWFWHNAGEAHMNLAEYDEAIEMFKQALDINENHKPSQDKLNMSKEMQG